MKKLIGMLLVMALLILFPGLVLLLPEHMF